MNEHRMNETTSPPPNAWGSAADTDVTDAELIGGPEFVDVDVDVDLDPAVLERAAVLRLAREALEGAAGGVAGEGVLDVGDLLRCAGWLLGGRDPWHEADSELDGDGAA